MKTIEQGISKPTTRTKLPVLGHFTAAYVPASHPLSTDNPLVNALPPVRSNEEWITQLFSAPTVERLQLEAEPHIRSYHVENLKHLFIPSAHHTKLARRIDQLIRWGYGYRHPHSTARATLLQETYAQAQAAGKATTLRFSDVQPICSYSLIGGSGMGKSTSVERILASYPQCIHHPEHQLTQLVWLKVDCPKGGSVKDLAISILNAFDRLLGTSYAPARRRDFSAGYYTSTVSHLAVAHHLGVLVLDEMQNLNAKRSGGREEMLNWFQELVNDLKVPIALLGTYKATKVLQLDMRHARRASILGSEQWDPLKQSKEFDFLVRTLWKYQWLRSPGDLSDEMKSVIYEETQGIRAFIVDMFLVAQLYALWKGDETLTPKLFRKVARSEFSAVQPMLGALRSRDPARIRKFDDLVFYDLDEHIELVRNLIPAEAESVSNLPARSSAAGKATVNVASACSLSESEAKQLVMKVMDGASQSARALTTAACRLFYTSNQDDEKAPEASDA